jgi:hypothetical protein
MNSLRLENYQCGQKYFCLIKKVHNIKPRNRGSSRLFDGLNAQEIRRSDKEFRKTYIQVCSHHIEKA